MTDHNEAMRLADALAQPGVRYATETEAQAKLHRIKNQAEAAALIRKQAERIAELESAQAGIIQAITDPENQPSQYGTVTLDYLSDKLKEWERRYAKRDEQADKAEAERDTLRAEVERLRVDAERMDWLETHATDAHAIHDKDGHVQSFQFDRDEDDSLRAAIDTARKATQ